MISKKLFNAYVELLKPRILMLVLITATLGYFLGAKGIDSLARLIVFLIGVGCTCGGASVLNHYVERDVDRLMQRTKRRPIPTGVIAPNNALLFGILLVLFGVFILFWKINVLTAFLSLLSAFLYVLVYTPLKRISWLNTSIGAIPGALPPMGGWVAATGQITFEAWILFFILFLWQHPHFYAIAWMCKEDYKRGGFKMLPIVHPDGKSTFFQIKMFSLLLIPISLIPTLTGMTGSVYFLGTLVCGISLLLIAMAFSASKTTLDAKKLLRATVVYLPVLLILIVLDVTF